MYRTSKHTQQLGVGGLLGGELLIVQTTVIYISAGKTGLVTLTFGGLFLTQPLGVYVVTKCRYITPPRLLVPGSKVYTRQNYGKQK